MGIEFLDLTRRMGQSFVKTAPKPKMLMQFFSTQENQDTEIIEIDKQFKGIRIAAFVSPDAVADGTEKLSFDEHTFKLPTLQDVQTLTSKELKKRLRGQNVYTMETFAGKAAIMVMEIQQEQREMVENAMELMAIDACFNGQLTVVGKGENRIVDFDRAAANTVDLGLGSYWDEAGGTPESDIPTFIELIGADGSNATHIIGRVATISATITKLESTDPGSVDGRHVDVARYTFQSFADVSGAIYFGMYKGVELWGYDGNYTDSAGDAQKAVPAKKIVVLSAANGNVDIAGYAGDMDIDYPEMNGETRAVIDSRNAISKVSREKKVLDIEIIQTRAPMLIDANSTIVATVLV
jgi:hypothetical protein